MKKTLSFILVLTVAFINVLPTVPATATNQILFVPRDSMYCVSEAETELVRLELDARGLYDENMTVEPMYDSEGAAAFLLGRTSTGYAILARDNGIVLECGELQPFTGYENCKKYYGGPLSHYIKCLNSGDYLNLASGRFSTLPVVDIPEPVRNQVIDPGLGGDTYKVINPQYITRYAHGYNESGTCNVVACGIALNYIKREYNLPILSVNRTPELLTATGLPQNANENLSSYPKAENLNRFLELYFIYNVNLLWGANYVECIDDYLEANVSVPGNRPIFTYKLFPSYIKLKNSILASKPVIVQTSTSATSPFDLHTMVAYGCRKVTGNSTTYELLVHTGWYNPDYHYYNGSVWEHLSVYINKSWVTYGYFFTIPGGN